MQRQAVLYDQTKQFRFLLAEAALHAHVGPPSIQRGRLDRLLVLMSLDTIETSYHPTECETARRYAPQILNRG